MCHRARAPGQFREVYLRPLSRGNTKWASRDLNPGPTDYECGSSPPRRLAIDRFLRGSLTLADLAGQRFSLLCATNAPPAVEAAGYV